MLSGSAPGLLALTWAWLPICLESPGPPPAGPEGVEAAWGCTGRARPPDVSQFVQFCAVLFAPRPCLGDQPWVLYF